MYRFYVDSIEKDAVIGSEITVTGEDVNHIKNVLRMRTGDMVTACSGNGMDYYCLIKEFKDRDVRLIINSINETKSEPPVKIYLYQGMPKKDKMELIIQKAVELGVYEIIPVITKRTIIKLEDKAREDKKLKRWQMISESAAKQSGRGLIPKVMSIMLYDEALIHAANHDLSLIPYESASGMEKTRELVKRAAAAGSAGIFIGPEGGYEDDEIHKALEKGYQPVTLGNRILRTETAALTMLSYINYELF